MNKVPFALKWQVDLGQEILALAPALMPDKVVLPLADALAWVDLPAGQVAHLEHGQQRVMAVLPFGDGVVAVRQDGAATWVDAFDARARRRWRTRLDVGVGRDCLQASADRVCVVGSDAQGLQAVWLDAAGREVGRWPPPAADLRLHHGSVYCALSAPVDGHAGVVELVDGRPKWRVDALAWGWGLDGSLGVLDTWNGWQATSELVGFSLDDGAVRFRAAGGPNATLLPAGGRLAHLETAATGPVVVLREMRDGTVLWRSAPVGADEPGLFGRCTGAATLLDDDIVVWLHGRALVRLALADGGPRGAMALQSLPPAGVTATAHGLLVRYDRKLSMLALTP